MKRIITLIVLAFLASQLVSATTGKNSKNATRSPKLHEWPTQKKFRSTELKKTDYSVTSPADKLRSRIQVKSPNLLMQRLDSAIHQYATPWKSLTLFNDEKVLFYYNANQVQTHEIIYSYDISQSVWELNYKTDYTYYPNGLVESITDLDWDDNLLQWVPGYKVEFSYDANGNLLTEEEFYMYAPSTVWEQDRIYEYEWNVANLMTKNTEKYWNEDSLAYINQYLYEFTYSNGIIDNTKVHAWNESQSIWVNQNKYQYVYNTSMQLTELDGLGWNGSTNQWELNYKTVYSYNANAYLVLEEGSEFYNSNWQYSYKTEYQYDILGNRIESENFYFNSFDTLWEANLKEYVDYDLSFSLNDLILPTAWWWYFDEADYMITEMRGERWMSNTWEDEYEDTFYYSTVNVTGIKDQDNATVKVYPNPASRELFVRWDAPEPGLKFELFDLSGRKVLSRDIDRDAKIDVDFLGQGFYFYQLSNDHNLIASGKISIL